VLEDVAFGTDLGRIVIDGDYVRRKVGDLAGDEDLSRYVL
jgi:ATP-dependent protease HslVU (ClpYQ) ATPase subunit